jgi:predicted transcriptional regulator
MPLHQRVAVPVLGPWSRMLLAREGSERPQWRLMQHQSFVVVLVT